MRVFSAVNLKWCCFAMYASVCRGKEIRFWWDLQLEDESRWPVCHRDGYLSVYPLAFHDYLSVDVLVFPSPVCTWCGMSHPLLSPFLPPRPKIPHKNHLLFWLWRGLSHWPAAVCIIDCENSPCNKWRGGADIWHIWSQLSIWCLSLGSSDIYLIFSPGVHFQLGCARRPRRLNLRAGSQLRLWEIQRKRQQHNISKRNIWNISQVSGYLPKTSYLSKSDPETNLSSTPRSSQTWWREHERYHTRENTGENTGVNN